MKPGELRRIITGTAGALAAGGAWGSLAAIGAESVLGLSEAQAWLWVGLPAGILVILALWRRLPRILGFEE